MLWQLPTDRTTCEELSTLVVLRWNVDMWGRGQYWPHTRVTDSASVNWVQFLFTLQADYSWFSSSGLGGLPQKLWNQDEFGPNPAPAPALAILHLKWIKGSPNETHQFNRLQNDHSGRRVIKFYEIVTQAQATTTREAWSLVSRGLGGGGWFACCTGRCTSCSNCQPSIVCTKTIVTIKTSPSHL